MRHLNKTYPYQKPSNNRSSKNMSILIKSSAVFPYYKKWSNEQLEKAAKRCKNKINCFQDVLNERKSAKNSKLTRKAS